MVFIQGLSKLVDLRRDLESLEKDSLLSLESDVSRPSHKSGEILLGLDISTNSEASGSRLEKRVSLLLNLLGDLGGFLGSLRLLVMYQKIYIITSNSMELSKFFLPFLLVGALKF